MFSLKTFRPPTNWSTTGAITLLSLPIIIISSTSIIIKQVSITP